MPRPPGAPLDPSSTHSPNASPCVSPGGSGQVVDAVHAARSGISLERHFDVDALTRLREACIGGASDITAKFAFSLLEGKPAIDGEMSGSVGLKCQRCLQPVSVPIEEEFRVVLVGDEVEEAGEFGAYEPVALDATRLDLRWLAEEQALLALPLVPLHEPGDCDEAPADESAREPADGVAKQRPFGNLRELLQKRRASRLPG